MILFDIITIAQVLSGASVMLLAIFLSLQMRKDVAKDLQGKWLAIISLMALFFICYIFYVFVLLSEGNFPFEIVAGTVFLGGAFFVYLVVRITGTTLRYKSMQDRELQLYAEKMSENIESLKEINEELEQEIAQRKIPEEALRRSEEKYSSLVESTEDSIYLIDRSYRYLFINKRHQLRLGISEVGYEGKGYKDFHTPEETKLFTGIADEVFRTGTSARFEHKSRRDKEYFLLTLSPVIKIGGEISAVTVVSKNITELKKMETELRTLSLTDALTGLYNRRGFLALAEQHLKIAGRMKTKVFMMYADMDALKGINDAFGHQEGDTALKETARILSETFRESDIVSRIGGDEFVVMPVGNSAESTALLTTRLDKNLRDFNAKKILNYSLSLSIGITHFDPAHPVSIDELLSQGDKLMYEQKLGRKSLMAKPAFFPASQTTET
ncbi:MAG: diguanylate cyclase [Nitrospiraceae bacterium]|nr:MAG: diguanylate cyclase [Nitrospiraceae bacterium]